VSRKDLAISVSFCYLLLIMWRIIKKWWLLQQLDKAIALHSEKESIERLSSGGKVLLTRSFFVVGTDDYVGIARKSAERFSWILWQRKNNPERLKKRIREYNTLFESCVKDGYIYMQPTEGGVPMPTPTNTADDVHGWFGLIQLLGNKFTVVWGIITAVITFLIGLNWHEILGYFLKGR